MITDSKDNLQPLPDYMGYEVLKVNEDEKDIIITVGKKLCDYKEAIEALKYAKTSVSFFGQEKSLDLSIEALEKQISKDVINKQQTEKIKFCPICSDALLRKKR